MAKTAKLKRKRSKIIDALVDPKTPEEWNLAMNDPLSPIYKLMMNILLQEGVKENILQELIIIRNAVAESEKVKEKEELLQKAIQAEQEEDRRMEIESADRKPTESPAVPWIMPAELAELDEQMKDLEEEIAADKEAIKQLQQEASGLASQIREDKTELAKITKRWDERQEEKRKEVRETLIRPLTEDVPEEDRVELVDQEGRKVDMMENLIDKISNAMQLSSPEELKSQYPELVTEYEKYKKELLEKEEKEKQAETKPSDPAEIEVKIANYLSKLKVFSEVNQHIGGKDTPTDVLQLMQKNFKFSEWIDKLQGKYFSKDVEDYGKSLGLMSNIAHNTQEFHKKVTDMEKIKEGLENKESKLEEMSQHREEIVKKSGPEKVEEHEKEQENEQQETQRFKK
ncbi:hypothetical protein [Aquicella lusitana]|uniref:Uncharacterized protein n=1 Tax=Aquicella lusitana TaxID=254246 RepID=A0A370GA46_9COXI|nr:hypothetical protein [Aquicella lusitana]RDI40070.1 hypothetical protein C8D86_12420 [Aquicella lusitana]VVC72350.1 hypothetical protein AQULUS_00600 [Aquicella lusitana]